MRAILMKTLSTLPLLGLLLCSAVRAEAADPRELLAQSKEAAGGAAWDQVRTVHSKARVETGGLSGPVESWEDALTGRSVSSFQLGSMTGAEGFDGTSQWSMDPSGQVTVSNSGDAREGGANAAYRSALAYWYPDRHAAGVAWDGERIEDGRKLHVLRIHPEGGRPFELWIDAATHLFDRTVEKTSNETRTTFLTDYREVAGLRLPFRTRSTNGETKYDTVVILESVAVNEPVDEARFSPPASKTDDFSIAGGKTSTTLPFELINNHIYVDAKLDGRPLKLLFDSGGANVVTRTVAGQLGLKSEGAAQGRGAGEKTEEISFTKVGELRVGDVTLRDQTFFVFPLESMEQVEGIPFPGLIGFEVFKRFVVRVDYAQRLLTFTFPDAFTPPKGAVAVPFTFDEHTPQVEGKIDGVAGTFTIDTGSRSSLTLNRPFSEKNGFLAKLAAAPEAMIGWGVGGGVRGKVARAGLLELGDVKVPSPVLDVALVEKGSFADPYLAGNVGGGVLKRFTVTFDYGRQKLWFEPNGSYAGPDTYDRAGVWLNRDDAGYRVADVLAGGPAAEAGLKVGDLIVALDGRSATEMLLNDARQRLKDAPGTRVRMAVRAGEATREVTVVLRDLV